MFGSVLNTLMSSIFAFDLNFFRFNRNRNYPMFPLTGNLRRSIRAEVNSFMILLEFVFYLEGSGEEEEEFDGSGKKVCYSEVHSELCQASKLERFPIINNGY